MFVAVYKDFVLQGLIQSWICFVNGSYTEHYPVPEPEGHYYAMGFSLSQGLINFNFQCGSIINTLTIIDHFSPIYPNWQSHTSQSAVSSLFSYFNPFSL